MAEIKLVKFKIKPGKKEAWLKWIGEMKRREEEVIETLKNEDVISESCFMSENNQFIYYFMEVEDFERMNKKFKDSQRPIDTEHKKVFNDCLEFMMELDNLFYFKR